MVENLFSSKIIFLQTNGGGEFINKEFSKALKSNGIQHRLSCPYTPEQNCFVEQKH